ncbi:YcxB family protein [Lachnospira multipara]|uniref:YcxB family protein n=1 Tax=Lachnospira multipara TaxID=28051 RepID=UPI0004857CAC|nr:YcxB family protein [Lachnospira multipara]
MVIKNSTVFTQETLEGLNKASNFRNEKYKRFKLIYNLAGLVFLMLFVRYMVLLLTQDERQDVFLTVFYGLAAGVFLFIGMYLLESDSKKRFNNLYKNMIGLEFKYTIDSEEIEVEDEEQDVDVLKWKDVYIVEKDSDYIYIFFNNENGLALNRAGFSEGSDKDLLELSNAILQTRQETKNKDSKDTLQINEESIDDRYVTKLDIENEEHQSQINNSNN